MRLVTALVFCFFSLFSIAREYGETINIRDVQITYSVPSIFKYENNYIPGEADYVLIDDKGKKLGYRLQIQIETPSLMQDPSGATSKYLSELSTKKETPTIDDYLNIIRNNKIPSLINASIEGIYGNISSIKIKNKWVGEEVFEMDSDSGNIIIGSYSIECALITSAGILYVSLTGGSNFINTKMTSYGELLPEGGIKLKDAGQAKRIYKESRVKDGKAPLEIKKMWEIYDSIMKSLDINDPSYEKWYSQNKDQITQMQ